MPNLVIPVDNSLGNYTQRVSLDGVVYLLGFRWNDEMGRWILDVSDSAGNPLVLGTPVLEEVDLLARFRGVVDGVPAGKLVAIDGTGQRQDPTDSTFGVSVQLCYIPAGG